MKMSQLVGFLFLVILFFYSCFAPQKTIEEEKVISTLSNIQKSLEANADYEQFALLLNQAKIEIDVLKSKSNTNSCFLKAVERCYSYYDTGGKAWQKKMEATDMARKNDMDLTFSVLQSQAAVSIQMANRCYQK